VVDNLKHKTLLILTYSKGLRYAEAGRLKIKDIDNNRKLIYFNIAKGKKINT
jgi:integrase/recombinase XerD